MEIKSRAAVVNPIILEEMALPRLSLRHNFLWTLVGNFVYAGCQWGMVIVIAKLGAPEMVGQFALGLAVSTPVIMFANLQLRGVQVTDARREYLFGHYLGLRLLTSGLALLVILCINWGAGYRRETALVIMVVGMSKAIESLSDILYGLLQQHERMDRIAISKMVKGPASLLALGLGVYLTGRVLWGVIGLAIAWALVLFCIDLRNGALILKGYLQTREKVSKPGKVASLRPLWGSIPLRRLLWLSLPLGFAAMLVSFNSSLPSYFIERYLGEEQLGIFSALIYFLMAGGMVVNALAESAFARLAIYYESGNGEAFRSLLLKLVGIGLLLGVPGILVALVAGRQILTLVYTPKYAEHATLFIWVMVVAAFSYMSAFLMNGMTAVRYFKAQIPLFSLVTVILALSCFWLIPAAGLQGAVMVIFIGVIARSIGSLVIVSHGLRQPHVKPVTWAAG